MNQKQVSFKTPLCKRCDHYSICDKPCVHVEKILCQGNPKMAEFKDKHNNSIVLMNAKKEFRESSLGAVQDDGKESPDLMHAYSTINDSAFMVGDHKLTQAAVFIDRFFKKRLFRQIADDRGMTIPAVMNIYRQAENRIARIIEAIDRSELAKGREPVIKMPKRIKIFLLHVLFGLTNAEISRLIGLKHRRVSDYVNRMWDSLLSGDLDLLAYIPDNEIEAAKERRTKHLEKRRDYEAHRRQA